MSSFQSLDRAIDILFVFTKTEPRLTADEIARKASLPRGSIYRYINALMENGLLERNQDSNKFQLGYRLLYFQSVIHHSDVLEEISLPYLRKIHDATGETIQLTIYRNGNVLPIESIESTAAVRVAPSLGELGKLHAGANSKAILAFRPPEEIDEIVSGELERFTETTITDPVKLREELSKIRHDNYAYSHQELHYGAWGMAAPVLDKNGYAIASIGVSGPIFNMDDKVLEDSKRMVMESAAEVSNRLLYSRS